MARAQAKATVVGLDAADGSAGEEPSFLRVVAVRGVGEPRHAARAARRLVVLLVALIVTPLAGAAVALRASHGGPRAPRKAVAPATPGSVTYGGVGYRLLGISAAKTIPQRGASAVTASGLFEIVKLRLQAADRRSHVISSDLLALAAGGTYYSPSNPDDIGLSSARWGALTPAMRVPASGVLTVKAIFDVPPGVLAHHLWLHIGQFEYLGAAPAQILNLTHATACCAPEAPAPSVRADAVGPLVPSPVLG